MVIVEVGHFRQKIAGIRPGCGHDLKFVRAPDFAVDSWTAFAAGAIRGAASG